MDLSKAFVTVNHEILISKLSLYGINGKNLDWCRSYLTNRKQYIGFEHNKTDMLNIKCGVPARLCTGASLILNNVNDLYKASKMLDPMFADDTNFFYSDKSIKKLFETVNREILNITEWFRANKLSLNTSKTKHTFFYKTSVRGNISLQLPKLFINSSEVETVKLIKFLGVMLDQNLM